LDKTSLGESKVRIGVTGHRFLAEIDKLQACLEEVLDRIEERHPGRGLTVVSSLAEGSDRLVAQAAMQRSEAELIAVLPLPPGDYRRDFTSAASRAEFDSLLGKAAEVVVLPNATTRDQAYAHAGQYVADHADVLIALWDGQGAQGSGGTADIVHRALRRGIVVFHVLAGNRKPGTNEPTTLGEKQGRLIVHNT
jgi:hypothetical protein